jgi:hypothetical protein
MTAIIPNPGSCRNTSANPDTVRVCRHIPRHDMTKAQQVKKGDFTPNRGKRPLNWSVLALYRPHRWKKGVSIMPKAITDKAAIYLAEMRFEGSFSA